MSAQRTPYRRDEVHEDSDPVRVSPTGINMTFKTAVACSIAVIGIVIGATTWCINTTNTAKAHTETLAEHGVALHELRLETRDLGAKLDALLWSSGINPQTVLKAEDKKLPANSEKPSN